MKSLVWQPKISVGLLTHGEKRSFCYLYSQYYFDKLSFQNYGKPFSLLRKQYTPPLIVSVFLVFIDLFVFVHLSDLLFLQHDDHFLFLSYFCILLRIKFVINKAV